MKSSFYIISSEDIRVSLKDLSAILWILSFVMLLPLFATFWYTSETDIYGRFLEASAFIWPSLILYCFYRLSRNLGADAPTKTKNIMITVAMAWLIMALVGSIPFMMRGMLSPLDSFFESMSGWTTTGFSMISDFEGADRDILLFRGIMQGVGGLGVISLGMMVMLQGSSLGIGYSDIGVQKIKPGIKQTILESWKIYGLYILLGVVLLYIAGMSLFDAVNHSITAVATGGFSTHSNIGYFDSIIIEAILLVLMLLGMASFILHYRIFTGEWGILRRDEPKYFLIMVIIATAIISVSIWGKPIEGVDTNSVFDVVRKTIFHVISGMSTSGYNTVDFGNWPDFPKTFITGLMYVGGMSSSTAGGIRVIRFLILLKAIHYSLKKLILPKKAIVLMKVDGKTLRDDMVTVVGYSAAYMSVCIILSMILMILGYSTVNSIFTIMSAMGNDGLNVLLAGQWYDMSPLGKVTIIIAMWIGRIEIYPGLLILMSIIDRVR